MSDIQGLSNAANIPVQTSGQAVAVESTKEVQAVAQQSEQQQSNDRESLKAAGVGEKIDIKA